MERDSNWIGDLLISGKDFELVEDIRELFFVYNDNKSKYASMRDFFKDKEFYRLKLQACLPVIEEEFANI